MVVVGCDISNEGPHVEIGFSSHIYSEKENNRLGPKFYNSVNTHTFWSGAE